MRILFTLAFFIVSFLHAFSQERTITGRLTSPEDGSPLPGVNVYVKGTSVGTVTDAEGRYSITVPIGGTLVFAFVGLQTREVVVTENNLRPATSRQQKAPAGSLAKSAPLPRSFYSDSTMKDGIGVAVLTDETPRYKSRSDIVPGSISSIRRRGNTYVISSDTDLRRTGVGIQVSTSIGVERINKLPPLQDRFAQGRSDGSGLKWSGADQNEIFSWGPAVTNLEFDGSNYAFDRNGKLVPSGAGNGRAAKKYDALRFFRTGLVNTNELVITLPAFRSSTLIFDLENRTRSGVIPNATYQKTNVSASLKNIKLSEHLRGNTSVSFNRSSGSLLARGANLSSIIGSVYRTPVTFDNANGLSPASARSSTGAYNLSDNTKRSHAPGIADNPYGLVNELPDQEQFDRFMSSLSLEYSRGYNPFSVIFNGNVDRQHNTTNFGTPPGYSGFAQGRLTNREDEQTLLNGIITASREYNSYSFDGDLKVNLSYQVEHAARALHRTDGYYFDADDTFHDLYQGDSISDVQNSVVRTAHEIIFNAQFENYNGLSVRLTNRNYFSNTIRSSQYSNIFPTASASLDFVDILDIWGLDDLQLYSTISRTLREAPLLYTGWGYASPGLPIERYAAFYESRELFFNGSTAPETERKFETGVKLRNYHINAQLSYYNNMTRDFIAPVLSGDNVAMKNVAAIKNYGTTFSIGYSHYIRSTNWGIDLKWSKYNSVVRELYTSEESVALSGFRSVQSVLTPGKPMGAIYGTSYLRNADGKRIIGSDGFPIEDEELKMIGNPIPDWNLGCSGYIQWKQFKFSFLLDVRKGGDVWNGTSAVLDYLGRSETTGKQRNVSGYIFGGVDAPGNPNVTPVDFYDPARPLGENRWVRYGWDGVGEAYIEDASWLRLSELVLSYTARPRGTKIRDIKFALIGHNLFLVTPYSGVDPSGTLFGYGTGNGLDLFNTPSTRSYSAQITIKI